MNWLSAKGRIIKDITFFSVAQAFAGVVYFFYVIVSARLLGVDSFGLFQAVIGIYGIIFLFGHPLNLATIHAVASAEADLQPFVLGSFLRIAMIIGGACLIFFIAISPYLAKITHAGSNWPFISMAFLLMANTILTTFYGALQGRNQYLFFSISVIAGSVIVLILGITLIEIGLGASGAVGGYAGSAALLTCFFFTRRKLFIFKRCIYSIRRELVSLARPVAVMGTILIVINFPAVVARMRLTEDMAGLFGTLFSMRNLVLPFTFAVVLPLYSHTISRKNKPRVVGKAVVYVLFLGIVFVSIGILCPRWFFLTFYGKSFVDASRYMTLYGLALLSHMLSMVFLFDYATKETFSFIPLLIPLFLILSLLFIPDLSIKKIILIQILSWSAFLCFLLVLKLSLLFHHFTEVKRPGRQNHEHYEA